MVRCKDCYYWSWDSRGDDEFECCVYGFMTGTDVYPIFNEDYPFDEYEEWDCSYFITEEEHEELEEKGK